LRLSVERLEVKSESIASIQERIRGANVLAAEDNELNRMVIQVILRKAGVNLELANDGQQALDLLQKKNFDVVFMDVQMPVLDGIQATREARVLGINTPIVGLSANAMQDKVEVCREAGMDDYLVKPYTEPDLLSMIDKWTASRQKESANELSDANTLKELDLSMLKQYVGNDEGVLREVISGYLQHLPPQLDRLEMALAGADIMAMRHELHQLKASLEIIGVRPEGCSFQDISTELKSNGLTDFAIAAIKSVIVQGRAGVSFLEHYINQ
jgi:CheY-like chemotaxis protein